MGDGAHAARDQQLAGGAPSEQEDVAGNGCRAEGKAQKDCKLFISTLIAQCA